MLAPQEKVVVVAPRDQERAIIEALWAFRAAHLIDFHEGRDAHGLKLGRPLAEGSKASERLVRLRSLLRTLGLEGRTATRAVPVAEIDRRLDRVLGDLEVNVASTVETRDRVRQGIKDLEERAQRLAPLAALPLRLEDYRGYDSLRPFVGTSAEPVTEADLAPVGRDALLFHAASVFAIFVPTSSADAAQEVLQRKGFREFEVPVGEGTPAAAIESTRTERARLEASLKAAEEDLHRIATDHGDFLVAAEEHLAIEVEKAEAPLSFGSTEYAFVVEAWVPKEQVPALRDALRAKVGDAYHMETSTPGHAHEEAHGAPADAQTTPAEAKHAAEEVPPSKYRNARFARPFEFFTSMFSMPRYGEIDPTVVLTFAFPLFFGFMIGDLGYGTLMAVIGLVMILKLGPKLPAARDLGIGIAAAGVVAMVFGGLVFHDAFGIPFWAHEGITPAEIAEATEHAHAGPLTACQAFAVHHGETTWHCLLTGQGELVEHHPLLSKIQEVSTLLIISVLAALVHLSIGLVFGMVNEFHHSKKHAAAKFAWLLVLAGFTIQVLHIARHNERLGTPIWYGSGGMTATASGACGYGSEHGVLGLCQAALGTVSLAGIEMSYAFVGLVLVGIVALLVTEGGIAVLEIPSLLANILSYTRLAGVAVAKAAMAVAFNALFLVGMVLAPEPNIVAIVFGALLVVVTQTAVLVLGILSSGIQAIRLNYVEFFTKFYKGGGVAFRPFGRERVSSVEAASP